MSRVHCWQIVNEATTRTTALSPDVQTASQARLTAHTRDHHALAHQPSPCACAVLLLLLLSAPIATSVLEETLTGRIPMDTSGVRIVQVTLVLWASRSRLLACATVPVWTPLVQF